MRPPHRADGPLGRSGPFSQRAAFLERQSGGRNPLLGATVRVALPHRCGECAGTKSSRAKPQAALLDHAPLRPAAGKAPIPAWCCAPSSRARSSDLSRSARRELLFVSDGQINSFGCRIGSAGLSNSLIKSILGRVSGCNPGAALSLAVAKTWRVDFIFKTTPLPNWLTVQAFGEAHSTTPQNRDA